MWLINPAHPFQTENAGLRVKLNMMRERGSNSTNTTATTISTPPAQTTPASHTLTTSSSGGGGSAGMNSSSAGQKSVHWSSPIAYASQHATPASSPSGNNGPQVSLVTQLRCHCTLYEYNNRDFRWVSRPGHKIQVCVGCVGCCCWLSWCEWSQVQVHYFDSGGVYDIRTQHGDRLLFFLSGQLEVHWSGGGNDRTLVMPSGKRIEIFQSKKDAGLRFEV